MYIDGGHIIMDILGPTHGKLLVSAFSPEIKATAQFMQVSTDTLRNFVQLLLNRGCDPHWRAKPFVSSLEL